MQKGIRLIEYALLDRLTPLELKVYQNPKTSAGTAKALESLARERALSADLIDALRQQVNRAADSQKTVAATLRASNPKPESFTQEEYQSYVERAQTQYNDGGEVQVPDDARVSAGAENGAYVQAWVWVSEE